MILTVFGALVIFVKFITNLTLVYTGIMDSIPLLLLFLEISEKTTVTCDFLYTVHGMIRRRKKDIINTYNKTFSNTSKRGSLFWLEVSV